MDEKLQKDLIEAVAQLVPGWNVVLHREGDAYRVAQERERKLLGLFRAAPDRLPIIDLRQEGADWAGEIGIVGSNR